MLFVWHLLIIELALHCRNECGLFCSWPPLKWPNFPEHYLNMIGYNQWIKCDNSRIELPYSIPFHPLLGPNIIQSVVDKSTPHLQDGRELWLPVLWSLITNDTVTCSHDYRVGAGVWLCYTCTTGMWHLSHQRKAWTSITPSLPIYSSWWGPCSCWRNAAGSILSKWSLFILRVHTAHCLWRTAYKPSCCGKAEVLCIVVIYSSSF